MTETELKLERLIAAPRAKIWKAWSTPEFLAQWWTPKPWSTKVHGFDLRAGGTFHISMHGTDGETHDLPGLFLEVVDGVRIVFTTALAEGWRPNISDMPITAIISMEDAGGSTKYVVRVLHKDAEDRKRHEEMGFEGGWGTVITQLEDFAQGLD